MTCVYEKWCILRTKILNLHKHFKGCLKELGMTPAAYSDERGTLLSLGYLQILAHLSWPLCLPDLDHRLVE